MPFYIIILVAVYLLFHYLVFPIIDPFDIPIVMTLESIYYLSLTSIAFVIFAIISQQFKWFSTNQGKIMFLLGLGFICFFVAEVFWFGYNLMGIDSFPSAADIFYIIGYIPIIIGLILNVRLIKYKFKKPILVLWIVLSVVLIVGVMFFEIIPFLIQDLSLESIITIIYPVEDLIIITITLIILLKLKSGEIAKPWLLIVIGFIFQSIGDIWFTYTILTGTYMDAYNIVDLFLSLGYLIIIAGGYYFRWLYKAELKMV